MIAQLKELQGLSGIDPVILGRCRKDLLEARQLQIVDIEELPTPGLDQAVQRSDMAVIAFHSHGNPCRMVLSRGLDTSKEVLKARRRMGDFKLLEQPAIRQPDGHAVTARADINTNTKFQ